MSEKRREKEGRREGGRGKGGGGGGGGEGGMVGGEREREGGVEVFKRWSRTTQASSELPQSEGKRAGRSRKQNPGKRRTRRTAQSAYTFALLFFQGGFSPGQPDAHRQTH